MTSSTVVAVGSSGARCAATEVADRASKAPAETLTIRRFIVFPPHEAAAVFEAAFSRRDRGNPVAELSSPPIFARRSIRAQPPRSVAKTLFPQRSVVAPERVWARLFLPWPMLLSDMGKIFQ